MNLLDDMGTRRIDLNKLTRFQKGSYDCECVIEEIRKVNLDRQELFQVEIEKRIEKRET